MQLTERLYNYSRRTIGRWPRVALLGLSAMAQKRGLELRTVSRGQRRCIRIRKDKRQILIAAEHYRYALEIVEDFEYYHGAVISEQIEGWRTSDYSQRRVHKLTDSGVEFLFTSLPESDITTKIYLQHANLRPGHVVFDLGAYCGASAYFFSQLVGDSGSVYCFEPDLQNFSVLQRNIKYHRLQNVQAINAGIWSSSTTLQFQSEGNMGSGVASVIGRRSSAVPVHTMSLDDALVRLGVRRLDFVKMDIEGAEVQALTTAKAIWKMHPRLVIEPHIVNGVVSTGVVCELLAAHGYRSELLKQANLSLPLIFGEPTDPLPAP